MSQHEGEDWLTGRHEKCTKNWACKRVVLLTELPLEDNNSHDPTLLHNVHQTISFVFIILIDGGNSSSRFKQLNQFSVLRSLRYKVALRRKSWSHPWKLQVNEFHRLCSGIFITSIFTLKLFFYSVLFTVQPQRKITLANLMVVSLWAWCHWLLL